MAFQLDIAHLLTKKAYDHLQEAFKYSKKGESPELVKEIEECIQAVILFQSAMEAVITEEIENDFQLKEVKKENELLYAKHKSLSFKNKWEKAYDILQITSRKSLDAYLIFYSTHRIPISHPKSRYVSLEEYTYSTTEQGMNNGREAMNILMKTLKKSM